MAFCPNCGKEIKEGQVFCPGCGKQLPQMTQAGSAGQNTEKQNPAPGKKSIKEKALEFEPVSIAAVALAVIAFLTGSASIGFLAFVGSIIGLVRARKHHKKGWWLALAAMIIVLLMLMAVISELYSTYRYYKSMSLLDLILTIIFGE